jgi:hypothetical protein
LLSQFGGTHLQGEHRAFVKKERKTKTNNVSSDVVVDDNVDNDDDDEDNDVCDDNGGDDGKHSKTSSAEKDSSAVVEVAVVEGKVGTHTHTHTHMFCNHCVSHTLCVLSLARRCNSRALSFLSLSKGKVSLWSQMSFFT